MSRTSAVPIAADRLNRSLDGVIYAASCSETRSIRMRMSGLERVISSHSRTTARARPLLRIRKAAAIDRSRGAV
jgi:hypothetical protein